MKDVAYLLGSCLDGDECARDEQLYLNAYFSHFREAVDAVAGKCSGDASSVDIDEVEQEWRTLFPWAWADFHRFLCGWAPDHQRMNFYSEAHAMRVVAECEVACRGGSC
jgi:hypothetical protein